jgi:dTMP kinase
MFITFEGLDFCGKSTQVNLLNEYFVKKNKKVKIIREPGGTEISEQVRNILLDNKNERMYMETELLLFSASRSQLVRELILPSLRQGYYLISDRFHDSLTVYQGYGRGVSLDFIQKLNSFVIENAQPDITFFIDIEIDEILKRKTKVNESDLDRIENSGYHFYEKVRNGYLELKQSEKRFRLIDGIKSIGEIHNEIIIEVEKYEQSMKGK